MSDKKENLMHWQKTLRERYEKILKRETRPLRQNKIKETLAALK